jgi:von Willebrand factor type A domain/Secretion system C-terminal sorting domain
MSSQAQLSLTIDTLDASQYPDIRIVFRVFDGGFAISGLNATNFTVFEDGVIQAPIDGGCLDSVTSVSSSIMLLLDRSGSMEQAFSTAQTAAKTFIDRTSPEDEFEVYSFGGSGFFFCNGKDISFEQGWTNNKTVLKASIDNIDDPCGGTPLWESIVAGTDDFVGRTKNRVMVVLTDGEDSYNDYTYLDAVDAARSQNITVFTIGLGDGIDAVTLRALAEQTGGKYFQAPSPQDLEDIYRLISEEIAATGKCEINYVADHDCLDGSVITVVLQVSTGSRTAQASASYQIPFDTTTFSYVDIMIDRNFIVDADEDILVPVILTHITDNRAARFFEFDITYNTQALELLEVFSTNLTSGYSSGFQNTINGAKITMQGLQAVRDTGIMAILNFKAMDSDVSLTSDIIISNPDINQLCTVATATSGQITINGFCERVIFRSTSERLETRILPNRPNPFNPGTNVVYTIGKEAMADLKVYDSFGKLIRTLVHEVQIPGQYTRYFDGSGLPNGTYYLHLESGDASSIRRIVLLK